MYEIVQHTADVRMHVHGKTREELFADAVRGLMDVMKPEGIHDAKTRRQIHAEAPDPTSLLVDFLNDILTGCHIHREVVRAVAMQSLSDTAVDAAVDVQPVNRFGEDVKAVTYHEAEVRHGSNGWSTTLVFDI